MRWALLRISREEMDLYKRTDPDGRGNPRFWCEDGRVYPLPASGISLTGSYSRGSPYAEMWAEQREPMATGAIADLTPQQLGEAINNIHVEQLYQNWAQLGVDGLSHGLDTEASARAHKLLMRLLDKRQQNEYLSTHCFNVFVGPRRYRLDRSNLQVRVYEADEIIENWCAYLPNAPREDTLICQLLLLRDDPVKLRSMAKVTKRNDYSRWGFEETAQRMRGLGVSRIRDFLQRAGYNVGGPPG